MESTLILLAVLACPVGMGLMMWFMSRGSKRDDAAAGESAASVEQLRAEQARLGHEIERRDSAHADAGREPARS